MNNTFDFSYFVPTPDTTANCALSRWNDSLMGLSDFLKAYMSSRQSLEFGFSRNLNIKELLNLAENTVYDDNHKFDYVINYRKFGDIKANVCGFDIPIVDFNHPFLVQEVLRNATTNEIIDFLSPYKVGISHVYNCNSTLSESERVEATKDALDIFKTAIQDQTLISDDQLHIIFKKNNGSYRTRQQIINELDTAISVIDNLSSGMVDFIFGFESREELESISGNYPTPGTTSYNTSSHDFYRDFCCNTYCCTSNGGVATFILNISDCYKQEFQDRYLTPFGIEFSYVEPLRYQRNANEKSHLLLFFKFDIIEKPTIAPFVSHDGTLIPTTEQRFNIQYSLQYSKNIGTNILYKSYWDNDEECPVYFDAENVAHPMTLESNINGMGGRDYTFWSSPVQKTESGYQFECCMPLAFYNAESDSYSNEYYATNSHEGIEIGEVMYRVPVVKRMRQNIEEAIVNTHLTKCLGDLVSATNENAEDDDTVVLGGVVVDDFTEGLYPVAERQSIASETEYGEVKIVKATEDVLDLMYHYSETGELSYQDVTMPETGRAIDMITLFDTLKDLGGGQPLRQQYFVINGENSDNVNVLTNGYIKLNDWELQDDETDYFYTKLIKNLATNASIYTSKSKTIDSSSISIKANSIGTDTRCPVLALGYNESNHNTIGASLTIYNNGPSRGFSTTLNMSSSKIYTYLDGNNVYLDGDDIYIRNNSDSVNKRINLNNDRMELKSSEIKIGFDNSNSTSKKVFTGFDLRTSSDVNKPYAYQTISLMNNSTPSWEVSLRDDSNLWSSISFGWTNNVASDRSGGAWSFAPSAQFGVYDLGNNNSTYGKWRDVFCERVISSEIQTPKIYIDNDGKTPSKIELAYSGSCRGNICLKVNQDLNSITSDDGIEIGTDGTDGYIKGIGTSTNIGKTNNRFNYVYCKYVSASYDISCSGNFNSSGNITGSYIYGSRILGKTYNSSYISFNDKNLFINTSAYTSGQNINLTLSSDAQGSYFYPNALNTFKGIISLGKPSNPFKDVYADNIHGLLPNLGYEADAETMSKNLIPIGAIMRVRVSSLSNNYNYGHIFTADGTDKYKIACSDGSNSNDSSLYITDLIFKSGTKFCALENVVRNSSNVANFLAMMVENP